MSELVSIIIPVYNAEKYIQQTFDSVVQQSYNNWEVIFVNDGSVDNTSSILDNISLKYPNKVKVIHKLNSGVSDTRNVGMNSANGKYIALLDADDFWLPHNLEKKIGVLEAGDYEYVFSDMYNVNENLEQPSLATIGKDDNILLDLLAWNGEVIPGPSSNLVFLASCLKKEIKFSKLLSTIADQHFTVQLAYYFKGKRIDEPLWCYRNLPQSMSKSVGLLEKDAINAYSLYLKAGFYPNKIFILKSFAKMYLILAGSYWKNAKNYGKSLDYILKSFFIYPPLLIQALNKKLFEKN